MAATRDDRGTVLGSSALSGRSGLGEIRPYNYSLMAAERVAVATVGKLASEEQARAGT